MKPAPILTLFISATCLLLGWLAYIEWNQAAVPRRLHDRPGSNPALGQTTPRTPTPRAKHSFPTIGFAIGNARSSPLPHPARYPSRQEILREHPEYAAVLRRRKARSLIATYEQGIEALGLPPAVAARLCQLLIERQLSAKDAKQVAQADGIPSRSAWLDQAVNNATTAVDAQIANLIGPEGERQLQVAQRLNSYQQRVRSASPAFVLGGENLTPQQAADLAQAWYSADDVTANPDSRQPGFMTPDASTNLAPGDELLLEKAARILSPTEVGTLRRYLEDQNIERTVMASNRHK